MASTPGPVRGARLSLPLLPKAKYGILAPVGYLPTCLVTAVSSSAAAGKNPWLPLAILLLIAQSSQVPGWLMDPRLHRNLQELGPAEWLLGLGLFFLVLSILDSLADKISWVEAWLTPISTAWRPFAAIAVSALIGSAALKDIGEPLTKAGGCSGGICPEEIQGAAMSFGLSSSEASLWFSLFLGLGALAGLISTFGKTGTRLLLTIVPIPGLRLMHSLLDDLFAWGVVIAGLLLNSSLFMLVLGCVYLGVGLCTAPILARLTSIQLRIFFYSLRKLISAQNGGLPRPPRWLRRALPERDLSRSVPAYTYYAKALGLCRAGYLVIDKQGISFARRGLFGCSVHTVAPGELTRFGLCETVTQRATTLAYSQEPGHVREYSLYLFPGNHADTSQRILDSAAAAGLVRARPGSEASRLPYEIDSHKRNGARFVPASRAGNLRNQALLSLGAATCAGILSGGVFIPIGFGYLVSPFKERFALGLLFSSYLAASVLGTFGFAWPVAVLYACLLNIISLRDLSRHALRAHLDGYVDRYQLLPLVPGAIWVTHAAASDRFKPSDPELIGDAPWRVVWRLLNEEQGDAERRAAVPAA